MNISLDTLKRIKIKQIMYPVITVVFLGIILTLFVNSISFISHAINTSLAVDDESLQNAILKVDLATYATIGKKLHLPIPQPATTETTPLASPASSSLETVSPSPSTSPAAAKKTDLRIAIYNSTGTNGLASKLKKLITDAGFTVTATGNQAKKEPVSLIKIRAGLDNYQALISELEGIVKQAYPGLEHGTLDTSSKYDIEIVIGSQ